MVAVGSLLLVLALSFLVVRVGAVALVMTGLSEEIARFQALSAFSGTGFTTGEAESILTHPARRRVVSLLIRFGSAGLVTSISTLMLSFLGAREAGPLRFLVLLCGVLLLLWLSRSAAFNRMLTPLISRTLARYTSLDLRDYADLLHLQEDYSIVEIRVDPDSWLASRQLEQLRLPAEGIILLGITRADGKYIGVPPPELQLRAGDLLTAYGREPRLRELRARPSHDQAAHEAAVGEHDREKAWQKEESR